MNVGQQVKRQLKGSFDRISNERLKLSLLQALPFWTASLLTGLVSVGYTKLFSLTEAATGWLLGGKAGWLFLLTPACFLTAWWLVKKWAPFARGSGIPQVMAAIELANPKDNERVGFLLNVRIMVIKILSTLFMVLGGGVIGREGPTIQIAGSIFRKINDWLPGWWPKISKRNMIKAGAAAGLAAAFNTPLGGVVFAVEELTKTHISYFKTALFTAVIIAGLTAQGLLGPYLYLGYPDVNHLSPYIFFAVILVAVPAGLGGAIMAKLILFILGRKSRWHRSWQQPLFIVSCALLLAALAFFISDSALGSGKSLMTRALFTPDKYSPWYIPLLRMAGPVLSFCTGGAGGVFAPSLSAGASIGSVMAGWLQLSPSNSNLLVLAGMVSFLTGVTRTPFTSAILVLEMTDRHNVIFHLLLAGMVSSLVAVLVEKHSFYDKLKKQYLAEVRGMTPARVGDPLAPAASGN